MSEQNTPTGGPKAPPRRVGLRVLLFASLALNMVIIGVVGGAILNFRRGDDHPITMSRELGIGPFIWAMEDEQRRALDDAARPYRSDLRSGRREWRRLYAEALEAIRADPFDGERFRSVMIRQADLSAQSREIGLELMVSQLEAMSSEAREAFADRLKERSRKMPGGKERKGKPSPPPPPQ